MENGIPGKHKRNECRRNTVERDRREKKNKYRRAAAASISEFSILDDGDGDADGDDDEVEDGDGNVGDAFFSTIFFFFLPRDLVFPGSSGCRALM